MKKVFSILALVVVMSAGLVSCEADSSEASLYENIKGTDGDEVPLDKRSTDGDEVPLDKRGNN